MRRQGPRHPPRPHAAPAGILLIVAKWAKWAILASLWEGPLFFTESSFQEALRIVVFPKTHVFRNFPFGAFSTRWPKRLIELQIGTALIVATWFSGGRNDAAAVHRRCVAAISLRLSSERYCAIQVKAHRPSRDRAKASRELEVRRACVQSEVSSSLPLATAVTS